MHLGRPNNFNGKRWNSHLSRCLCGMFSSLKVKAPSWSSAHGSSSEGSVLNPPP
jgi:hypothetical protein